MTAVHEATTATVMMNRQRYDRDMRRETAVIDSCRKADATREPPGDILSM